ncbi:hypothetical protein [Sporomusa sphaeroides]|uniref:Uncharacterized protein n=1 Tax=Sporomusa sphaeroides DSM 2875 TaxID=1337886 RepID=A0ABM9W5M8_9FIRM|nr:hypothetical protein [Sporomusa sphaeroides]MCM0758975.1 hypothetical protein [Sporomusa sphaeroides DSM 2875]OLS55050.1 hypothetical protein SPSPH_37870 [Sporomusa sphaeroides DSM 2875]CVK19496.1 hypothetical protein SSPH_02147 [Sporomusa sphaeroides DSM 2875]
MDAEKPLKDVIKNYVEEYHKCPILIQLVKNISVFDKIPDISSQQKSKKQGNAKQGNIHFALE